MNDTLKKEIDQLATDGLVEPEALVEFAAGNPSSALHAEFNWDDAQIGHEYRIRQAARIIKAYIVFEERTQTQVTGTIHQPKPKPEVIEKVGEFFEPAYGRTSREAEEVVAVALAKIGSALRRADFEAAEAALQEAISEDALQALREKIYGDPVAA